MRLHSHHREHHGLEPQADYEARKAHFEKWAAGWVMDWNERTSLMPRKHDVADALALADLHLHGLYQAHRKAEDERVRKSRIRTAARDGFAKYYFNGEDVLDDTGVEY